MLCQSESLMTTVFFKRHMVFKLRLKKKSVKRCQKKIVFARGGILIPIYSFCDVLLCLKHTHMH